MQNKKNHNTIFVWMLHLGLTFKVKCKSYICAFEIFACHRSVHPFTHGGNFLCDASLLSLLACLCDPAASPEPPRSLPSPLLHHLLPLTCLCAGLLLSPLSGSLLQCVCLTASGGGGSRLNPSSLLATERFGAGQGERAGDGGWSYSGWGEQSPPGLER